MPKKPPFDPNAEFTVVEEKPPFDPNKPFEVVEDGMPGKSVASPPQQPPALGGGGGAAPTFSAISPGLLEPPSAQAAPTPKQYSLAPDTADISQATTPEQPFTNLQVATAAPGKKEAQAERVLFNERFGGMTLPDIKRYKEEVVPKLDAQARVLQQLNQRDAVELEQQRVGIEQARQVYEREPTPENAARFDQLASRYNSGVSMLEKQQKAAEDARTVAQRESRLLGLQEYSLKAQQGSTAGALWNNALNSIGGAVSGLNSPFIDLFLAANPQQRAEGETQQQADDRLRRRMRSQLREAPAEGLGDPATTNEYIGEFSKGGFYKEALMGATGSLPLIATGPIGMMTQAMDGVDKEMESPEFDGVPQWKKRLFSATVGSAVGALEAAGFRNVARNSPMMSRILLNAIDDIPPGATGAQIQAILNQKVKQGAEGAILRIASGGLAEAETGGSQALVEAGLKEGFNASENLRDADISPTEARIRDLFAAMDGKQLFDTPDGLDGYVTEVARGAALEAVGGLMYATPFAVSNAIRKNKLGEMTTPKQFEMVEELTRDPNYPAFFKEQVEKDVEEGNITPEQAEQVQQDFVLATKITDRIPNDLPIDSRMAAFDIMSKMEGLKKKEPALVANKMEALKQQLQALEGVPEVPEATVDADGKKGEEPPPVQPTGNEVAQADLLTPFSAKSIENTFGVTPEVARATEAIADAMGLDKSKIKVAKGGEASPEALFQQEMDGWRSRLSESVTAKGQTLPADQWVNWMQSRAKEGAFSMEEAKWTGLSDWLASKGKEKVTPQQVREFLNEKRVKLEVKEYEEGSGETAAEKYGQNLLLPGGANQRDILVMLPMRESQKPKEDTSGWRVETVREIPFTGQREVKVYDANGEWRGMSSATTQSDEEIIDSFAKSRQAQETRDAERAINFTSSHYPDKNILFHLRVNDRTDADGKKVLFIEEIQSDWAQKGRKEGFDTQLPNGWYVQERAYNEGWAVYDGSGGPPVSTGLTKSDAINEARERNVTAFSNHGVPSAPFVTDTSAWVELAIKQAVRMAVEGGYDKISWTTGTQQNERYDLSKQVEEIHYYPADNSLHVFYVGSDPRTGSDVERTVTPEELPDVIGKEAAERLLAAPNENGIQRLYGEGLKIGGSGMKGFYDKIVPTVAAKVIKKMGGGKVGEISIVNDKEGWKISRPEETTHGKWMVKSSDYNSKGLRFDTEEEARAALAEKQRKSPQPSFDITPEMKKGVMQGVPLMQGEKGSVEFTKGGEAIIRALKNPDASTGIHELAHVARRFLFDKNIKPEERAGITDEHIDTAEKWAGVKDGNWTREAEEKFARGFERYLRDGNAPSEALKDVFQKFAQWLREIYQNLFDSPVREMVSPEMRKVFDALVTRGENKQSRSVDEQPTVTAVPNEGIANEEVAPPDTTPPPGVPDNAAPGREGPELVKKTTVGRAYEGTFRQEVKNELEASGLMREVEKLDDAEEQARSIIEKVGLQAALDAVNANDIKGGAGTFIWEAAIKDLDDRILQSTNPQEVDLLTIRQVEIIQQMEDELLSGGRRASAVQRVLDRGETGFNAASMTAKLKKDFGVDPSPELKEALDKIQDLKARIKNAEKRAAEADANARIAAIADSIAREKKRNKGKTYTQKFKGAADQFRRLKSKPMVFTDADGNRIEVKEMGFSWNELVEIGAKAIEKTGEIADGIAAIAEKLKGSAVFSSMDDRNKKAFLQQLEDYYRKESEQDLGSGSIRVPKQMVRDAVENGAKDIGSLVAVIKEQLKEDYPDATDREIRDAITDYGKVVSMNKDEISVEVRRLRRIGRDISALEDIQAKKRPLRSGLQRDKMDADERELKKKIRDGLKNLPVDEEVQAREMKTALDAAKTRARNRIEDLQREIETKQKLPRNTKSVEADAELKALIAEKEALQEQHDAIFEDAAATEEERLNRAIDATRRSIDNYEQRIREGDLDPKKPAPVKETPELKTLRAQRERAKAEYRKLQEDAGIIEKKRNNARMKAIGKAVGVLQERIRNKDFSKPEKKERIESDEVADLKAEKIRIQEQYDKEYYKHKLANRSGAEIAKDFAWEAWGLGRALNASLDASFVGVQGLLMAMSNLWHNPAATKNAFKNSFRAAFNEKKSEEWLRKIKAQPWYPKAKEAKLALTEPHAQLSASEELFVSGWTRVLWGIAGAPLYLKSKIDGGKAFENWMKLNPFRATERAAVAFLDTLRVERYLDGLEMLKEKKALGEKLTDKDYKDVADVVNTLTGRASLGKAEAIAEPLTKMIYSPRLWASQIKTFTPYGWWWLGKKSPTARKIAVQDWSRFVGTTLGIVALAALKLNNDDDDETKVELDPRSSEFLKIKLGKNVVIDPWGGRLSHVIFTTRALAGAASLATEKPFNAFKNRKGRVLPLGIDHKTPTLLDLTLEMGFNKAAPPVSFLIDAARTKVKQSGDRKTAFGQDYNMGDAALERITPMYYQTIRDLMKEEPNAMGVILSAAAFFGPVQAYEDNGGKKAASPDTSEASNLLNDLRAAGK